MNPPPRLLHCPRYVLPRPGEIYENNVLVEFEVSTQGTVMNGRAVEDGAVISTTASYGEALSRARCCEFRPGVIGGSPVPVRRSMGFPW